jgi:PEP-CTERM motif
MSQFRVTTVFLLILVASFGDPRSASANVVLVTDQSTYNQETNGLTTIDFNTFVPSGQAFANYSTPTGLVTGPVTFTGSYTSGNNFLYAITPAYDPPVYDAYPDSPTVLQGPSDYPGFGGSLDVALGGHYSAVASGLYVVTYGETGATSGPVTIAVTDGTGTYDFTITTSTQYINFVGFLSTSTITSIQYTTPDQSLVQYPNLSNFSYGMNSAVPEPSSLALATSGAIGVLTFMALRRLRAAHRLRH